MENLLFIDDDADIRLLFKSVFSKTYNVSMASSVAEAKEKIEETDFGVIVSDQCMPNETGLDFFKYMKEVEIQKPIRLLLTAFKDIEVTIEALNEGLVHKYLLKPLNAQEIKKEIHDAFQLYHANARKNKIRKLIDKDIEDQNEQISHQLHEGIAQDINAVNFFISSVGNNVEEQEKGVIDESKKLLMNTVGGVKKISNKIRPRVFAQAGLSETLKAIAEEEQEIALKILVDDFSPIKKELELHILRVVQYLLRLFKSNGEVQELDLKVTHFQEKELLLAISFSHNSPIEFLEIIEEMIKPYEGNIDYIMDGKLSLMNIIYPFISSESEE